MNTQSHRRDDVLWHAERAALARERERIAKEWDRAERIAGRKIRREDRKAGPFTVGWTSGFLFGFVTCGAVGLVIGLLTRGFL